MTPKHLHLVVNAGHRAKRTAPLPAWLADLAPSVVELVTGLAGDLLIVLDATGVVRQISQGTVLSGQEQVLLWQGRHWVDTSLPETRGKAERLWRELSAGAAVRQRQINHAGAAGQCLPLAWSGLQAGAQGPWLLLGQNLGPQHALQQALLAAQAALEAARWPTYSSPGADSPSPNRRSLT